MIEIFPFPFDLVFDDSIHSFYGLLETSREEHVSNDGEFHFECERETILECVRTHHFAFVRVQHNAAGAVEAEMWMGVRAF